MEVWRRESCSTRTDCIFHRHEWLRGSHGTRAPDRSRKNPFLLLRVTRKSVGSTRCNDPNATGNTSQPLDTNLQFHQCTQQAERDHAGQESANATLGMGKRASDTTNAHTRDTSAHLDGSIPRIRCGGNACPSKQPRETPTSGKFRNCKLVVRASHATQIPSYRVTSSKRLQDDRVARSALGSGSTSL